MRKKPMQEDRNRGGGKKKKAIPRKGEGNQRHSAIRQKGGTQSETFGLEKAKGGSGNELSKRSKIRFEPRMRLITGTPEKRPPHLDKARRAEKSSREEKKSRKDPLM